MTNTKIQKVQKTDLTYQLRGTFLQPDNKVKRRMKAENPREFTEGLVIKKPYLLIKAALWSVAAWSFDHVLNPSSIILALSQ